MSTSPYKTHAWKTVVVSSYIHQWNTQWAFARKHDIPTCSIAIVT